MVNVISKQYRIRYLLITILFVSLSCQIASLKGEEIKKNSEGSYFIERSTILKDITNGNNKVFYSSKSSELAQNTVQWSEKDYYAVASAFFKFNWRESTDDWMNRTMSFGSTCENILGGAQNALYIFYRVDKEVRTERTIYIDPYNNSIKWSESEFSPNIVKQNPIQTNNIITLEKVIETAEIAGGKEIRLKNNNECIVNINLINSGQKWLITYIKILDLYKLEIDSHTGEYLILIN
jgi:hypothetical protein